MAQEYQVNYKISLIDNASAGIKAFVEASSMLMQASEQFVNLNKSVNKLQTNLSTLNSKTYSIKVNTSKAINNVDKLIGRLSQVQKQLGRIGSGTATSAGLGGVVIGGKEKGSSKKSSSSAKSGPTSSVKPSASSQKAIPSRTWLQNSVPKNIGYRALGAATITTNNMGVDFLKGMGVAYGIAGAGTMMGNIISDATEYNNLIQTTKNILKTHDKKDNFLGRFTNMESIIRNVGIETKFTAPEVADASKFLAMAGFDIDDINASIRPIADIALVGDTDLGKTADLVTNIMTGYSIKPERIRKAADIMTQTFTMSNTTLTEIAEAYKYAGSLLSSGGISFEEATAGIGMLGNAGIKGSQAGTTMRTILANILNPTKKQKEAWDSIGIKTKNSNGTVRDLSDIFMDLHKKNISAAGFYKLFNKTAAQGAVSLAENIDRWNEIIRENFLSEGLTSQLAEEKKNTIQGLWAQLTSTITEIGMQSFEQQQPAIVEFIKSITTAMKSDEAKKTMQDLGQYLMDFMNILKDVVKFWAGIWQQFGGFLIFLIKIKLYISPVMSLFNTLKAIFVNTGGFFVMLAGKAAFLSGRLAALVQSFIGLKGASAIINNTAAGVRGYFYNSYLLGKYGKIPETSTGTPETSTGTPNQSTNNTKTASGLILPSNYNNEQNKPTQQAPKQSFWRGQNGKFITSVGGKVVGSAIGTIGGASIGETIGGSTGAWIGGTIGAALVPALMSTPYGWTALGIAAIGGLAASAWNLSESYRAARESHEKLAGSIKVVDGILTGEGLSITEKYYDLAYNKNYSLNDLVEKRVSLLKEELGLMQVERVEPNNKFDGSTFNEYVQSYENLDRWYYSGEMASTIVKDLKKLDPSKNIASYDSMRNLYWKDAFGSKWLISNPTGTNDPQDVLAAMSALYMEGFDSPTTKLIKDEFQNRLKLALRTNNIDEFNSIKNDWKSRIGESILSGNFETNTLPRLFSAGYDEVKGWSNEQKASSYPYHQGLRDATIKMFGPDAEIWNNVQTYFANQKNGKLVEQNVIDFLSVYVKFKEFLNGYDPENINGWINKRYGYYNGVFNPNETGSAEERAKIARAAMEQLIEAINRLSPAGQKAASGLYSAANHLLNLSNGYLWGLDNELGSDGSKPKKGDKKTINGQTYTYNDKHKQWEGLLNMPTLTDEEMRKIEGSSKEKDGLNNSTNKSNKIDPQSYESHYNKHNAAPKQVIVRIENLMNVESVDLRNPDNAIVINNLKGQLAQALVDVVHDFDESWNG